VDCCGWSDTLALIQSVSLRRSLRFLFAIAVGTYLGLHAAIKLRDLAILAMHGRQEANPAAPATLLPASSYSNQQVQVAAAKLQIQVRDTLVRHWEQSP
jgi:hypothetical protein